MSDLPIKFLYRQFFENKLLKSSGDAFQLLVNNLLSTIHPSFEKIETQGAIGDRKNDGYIRGEGIFFQMYGPKDVAVNNTSQATAVKKMSADFNDLKNKIVDGYWEEIKEYRFVFKAFRGSYPDVLEELKKLEKENPNITFSICDNDELLNEFSKLCLDKMSIVSETYIPEPDFDMVSFEVMGEIIKHLFNVGHSQNIDLTKIPPNFESKIEFNELPEYYAHNLRVASYKIDQLDDYLSSYSDSNIADLLCSIFKKLYDDSQQIHPDCSTSQFQHILNSCRKPSTPSEQLQSYETNSYVMIAKYFEACDIFKEPPELIIKA